MDLVAAGGFLIQEAASRRCLGWQFPALKLLAHAQAVGPLAAQFYVVGLGVLPGASFWYVFL